MKSRDFKLQLLAILLDEAEKTGHSLGTITLELMHAHNEFSQHYDQTNKTVSDPRHLKEMNKKMVLETLKKNHLNQRETAKELGIPKSTLCDWLKRWKSEDSHRLTLILDRPC